MSLASELPHLEQLWRRSQLSRLQGAVADPLDWTLDRLVIDGLGLNLYETLEYLHQEAPGVDAFEAWILARRGGAIDPAEIAQLNARLAQARSAPPPATGRSDVPAVLDASDLAFWDEHGYVVVHDAVPRETCRAAEQAIWEFLRMDADDPETWYRDDHGHTIWVPLVRHPAFDENRRAPRVRGAFAQLFGTDDLQVTIDRGGFNPPERPGWTFPGPHLHWDTSLALPMPLQIQGLLYLADTPADGGAFQCVPGFHRRIEHWLEHLPPGVDPRGVALDDEATYIAGRAGDLVLWHAALPHGASPNRSTRPRVVQYISMYPPLAVDARPWR